MVGRILLFSCVLAAASCSDDGGGTTPDAKPVDSAAANVVMVTCPATPAATVQTSDLTNAYMPTAVTVNQGQVVRFQTSAAHNVVPLAGMSDPGLNVGFNQTKCLMFTVTGTYKFYCGPHGFAGMVTVN